MLGIIVTIISILGIISYYMNNFYLLLFCTIIILIESIYNVFFTKTQNSFITEFIVLFIGLIISLFFKLDILKTLLVSLCFESFIMELLGYAFLIKYILKK